MRGWFERLENATMAAAKSLNEDMLYTGPGLARAWLDSTMNTALYDRERFDCNTNVWAIDPGERGKRRSKRQRC